ncbi:major facilitator superfamily domain-containing protein 6 [Ischnura elegans]|uniref:major facilitator superfamily domain-containing protein 6 n=1 Tax=Ischnura elegans TaxID=197161 RepID=UPI001ED88316|nr:major facilitator superfamily domain-containing protein 6 [Ischnura elegans]
MVFERINKKLVSVKAHYFFNNAGTAPVVPFLPTIAKQLGFSPTEVGGLYTILPVAGMLAKPACGALADRLRLHKLLFLMAIALTALTFFATSFIPESSEPPMTNVSLDCGVETNIRVHGGSSDCARQRLVENSGNGTVQCHLSCDPLKVNGSWSELCQSWNISEYCSGMENSKGGPDTLVPDKQSTGEEDVLNKLEFTVEVPLHHTLLVDSDLFFRVSRATFHNGMTIIPYCNAWMSMECGLTCNSLKVSEAIATAPIYGNADERERGSLFWIFGALVLVAWVGMAVTVSIGDAICFEVLGDRPGDYGRQRLWGSFGWGAFAALAGFLVDQWSQGQTQKNYTPVFYLAAGLLIIDFLNSTRLRHSEAKMSASIARDVCRLFLEFRIIVFVLWCVAIGLCTGLLWQFLFWHLEVLAGEQDNCAVVDWVKTLEGLVMAIQCFLGEIPFFFLSGWIVKKLGHENTMSLVLLAFGARMILYSLLTNPWYVLPIELLNGLTFGLAYATMTSYASVVTPSGTEATIQGLVGAVFEGVGVSLGSLLGGIVFEKFGGTVTFRSFGIAALCAFVLHGAVNYFFLKGNRPHNSPAFQKPGDIGETTYYSTPSEAVRILEGNDSYSARKPILMSSS